MFRTIASTLLAAALVVFAACSGSAPKEASPDAARAFYVGLAALQVGDDQRAQKELARAAELAPNEPAAWLNLGILQIRHKQFDEAAKSLEKAQKHADKNARVYETFAVLERSRGNFEAAQAALQKTIDLEPTNVKAAYALAKEKERQADDAAALDLYKKILATRPDNLEVRLEVLRLTAKKGDASAAGAAAGEIKAPVNAAEPETVTQYEALKDAAAKGDMRSLAAQVSFFRNVLLRDPAFRNDVAAVKYSDTTVGEPVTRPLVLKVPPTKPAAADEGLSVVRQQPLRDERIWSKFIYVDGERPPLIAAGDPAATRIGEHAVSFGVERASGLAAFDFDYDFKNDIALAGERGFRLYRQDGGFTDVTAQTGIGDDVRSGKYAGAWPFDVESDGDLDIVLARRSGPPVVLQNNSDGKFAPVSPFGGVSDVTNFAAGDLDEDGDADAVFLDTSGALICYFNQRGGVFTLSALPAETGKVAAFTLGDHASDGRLAVIAVNGTGSILTFYYDEASRRMTAEARETRGVDGPADGLIFADLDNNGAGDLIVSGPQTRVMLAGGAGVLNVANASVGGVADKNADGRLDLVAADGGVITTRGTRNYAWQSVRPRAAKTEGDQRVNSFGIGGELELRAGLLLQKRMIDAPVVHFGLGENTAADVLRVVWQNGYVQAEFDLQPNQTIAAEQRLKGSCPHLFAFDGESIKLVKDAPPWSPALGLKINAQDIFGVLETEEWFKVPGNALKPDAEGNYDLRITAEYWESFYIDHYSLLVVDHPEGTEVFTDERFAVPPVPLEVFTTERLSPFASAKDQNGADVAGIVKDLDELYLDKAERATFQGVAKEHFVEVELPADAPVDRRLAIIADGWVHPTDASINVQLGQSGLEKPRSLSLEVRDDAGRWKIAKENLGFPAGKMKTLVIDLPVGARAARLRTNMEIFWDRLTWAAYSDNGENKVTRLSPSTAELRYRGFSVIEKANDSSPEKPVYDRLLTAGQRWRDMEGYFTRFGDVLELLGQTDGRFVLANAGDEIVMKFSALPEPRPGYVRDFVLIGNGWIKDGDLNSLFSKTLIPLPSHDTNDYSVAPTTLENDPVYRRHRADWQTYHTRFVSPDAFRRALR
jgi:tetratricopeptide (TPR) repeat protein